MLEFILLIVFVKSRQGVFWVGEGFSSFFHDGSEGVRHSVLLAPQVVGARVDYDVAGPA